MKIPSEMTIEELHAEIEARKTAAIATIQKELEASRKVVRDLEIKLAEAKGTKLRAAPKNTHAASIPPAERNKAVIETLVAHKDPISGEDLGNLVKFTGTNFRTTIAGLIEKDIVTREGKARGTKYTLHDKVKGKALEAILEIAAA